MSDRERDDGLVERDGGDPRADEDALDEESPGETLDDPDGIAEPNEPG